MLKELVEESYGENPFALRGCRRGGGRAPPEFGVMTDLKNRHILNRHTHAPPQHNYFSYLVSNGCVTLKSFATGLFITKIRHFSQKIKQIKIKIGALLFQFETGLEEHLKPCVFRRIVLRNYSETLTIISLKPNDLRNQYEIIDSSVKAVHVAQ